MADRDVFHEPSQCPDSTCKLVSLVQHPLIPIGSRERGLQSDLGATAAATTTRATLSWAMRPTTVEALRPGTIGLSMLLSQISKEQ